MAHEQVWTDPLTPVVMLERTLRVFPERTAVVYGELRWTYAEFALEIGRMAAALRRCGVTAGDRVAVLAPNTPWNLLAAFAAPLIQAPLVTINTRLAGAEIAYILSHSGARVRGATRVRTTRRIHAGARVASGDDIGSASGVRVRGRIATGGERKYAHQNEN